jgi:hypothetical protein
MAKLIRHKIFKVRLSFSELSLIKKKAKEVGRTPSRYVRESALGKEIKARQFTDDEKQYYKTMVGVANNLNQIAKKYNSGDRMFFELQKTLESIQFIVDKLIEHAREN